MGIDLETLKANVRSAMNDGWKDYRIWQWHQDHGYGHGLTRHRIRQIMHEIESESGAVEEKEFIKDIKENDDTMEVGGICQARSLEALLALMDADLDTWVVDRWTGAQWGKGNLWHVRAWFKRKTHEQSNLEELIEELKEHGPVGDHTTHVDWKDSDNKMHRALEVSIMDPHIGLRAFKGPSCDDYDRTKAEYLWWYSIEKLIERAMRHTSMDIFERIVFVAGNDFLHADNVFHTTTAGTGQPEMDSWHHTFEKGEKLLIHTVNYLKKCAAFVDVVMVPGNHARQTEFALGRILNAYFHNDPLVKVDCGGEPYKFWDYGVNLIGYEHGHSIKPNAMAGLMANEMAHVWPDTWQREWHRGDQHREGVLYSEGGVVIKHLPSFVAANEWHKIKGFSWQHKASQGFVYDKHNGLICTPQVNAKEVFDG